MHTYIKTHVKTVFAMINTNKQKYTPQEKALHIKKTLGIFTAARYLNNKGFSLDAALYILTVKRYVKLCTNTNTKSKLAQNKQQYKGITLQSGHWNFIINY